MRNILIIIILCLITPYLAYSKKFEKCSNDNNSYEIDKCLKNLKSKLMNEDINIKIYSINKELYKNRNIFLSICGYNINKYKYTDRNGQLNINFKSKYLTKCEALINLNIISEYGLCKDGQYANAKWDSLELNDSIYFSCNTLK
jgi:hypothetical protein